MYGAGLQADAANRAANLANERYGTTRGDLAPYNQTGQGALSDAYSLARLGPTGGGPNYLQQAAAAQPGQMTQAELEATPGYQFNRSQGLKAVQSAAAARGLGVSGASMKGAGTFATGLADSTYQNQFNNAQTRFQNLVNLNTGQQGNLTNQFNRFNALATTGENAAAQTGTIGAGLANTAGQYLNAAGQAESAGITGAAKSLIGSANNALGYYNYNQLMGGGTTGGYPSGNVSGTQNNSDLLRGATYANGNTYYR
jgi:hypothetical protein